MLLSCDFSLQSTLSEEEGSIESTNGEGEQEGSQKSPGGEKSPGESSSTSSANPEDEDGSPCSSQMDPTSSAVPQQFRREAKSSDSTCARTDLVYIHPPAEEKKMATQTKVGVSYQNTLTLTIFLQVCIYLWL